MKSALRKMQIPAEITTDILSRLPVKTLKRFRCVSKSWCIEIDSPFFINMHLKKSLQLHSNQRLILRDCTNLYTLDLDKPNPTSIVSFPFVKNNEIDENHVIGSCNGLLALLNSDKQTIALYNPSTREHKALPFSPTEIKLPNGSYPSWQLRTSYGFGYDPINEDYKVVKIDTLDGCYFPDVRVYSLKSNSWERTRDVFPHCFDFQFVNRLHTDSAYGMFANGAVHWEAKNEMFRPGPWENVIVAFDFGVEDFRIISKPIDFSINEFPLSEFGVLGGCLCLFFTINSLNFVQIWVMKEYGVKDSWSKLCIFLSEMQVNPVKHGARPLAYSKSEDKVLLQLDFEIWFGMI